MKVRTASSAHPSTERPRPRISRGLLFALLVGALVRALQLFWAQEHTPDFAHPLLDARFHDYWARALLSGDWTLPERMVDPQITTTPYYRPPGYPHLLAVFYALGGGSYVAVRVFQIGLSLVGTFAVWHLALQLLGSHRRAVAGANVAALLWALCPSLIYFEGELVAASLAAVLTTVFLTGLLALRSLVATDSKTSRAQQRWLGLGLGLLLGAACTVRPNLIVLLALPLVWAVASFLSVKVPAPRQALLLIAAAAILTTLPITIRNQQVGGETVWISMNGPITALYGNHATADGYSVRVPEIGILQGIQEVSAAGYPALKTKIERREGRLFTFAEFGGVFRAEVFSFLLQHPDAWFSLTLKKAFLLIGPAEVANNKQVALAQHASPILSWLPVRWPFLATLALLGLVLLLRERRSSSLLVAGAVFFVLAAAVPFLAGARFRIPVIGLLAALAGPGLVLGKDWVGSWRSAFRQTEIAKTARRSLAMVAAVLLAGLLLFAVNWTTYAPDRSRFHLDRALAFSDQRLDQKALLELNQALSFQPSSASALRQRGLLLARMGEMEAAESDLRAAISAGGGAAADAALATVLTQLGRKDDQTLRMFETLLRDEPENISTRYNYGLALAARAQWPAAIRAYEAVLDRRPDHNDALNNLGRALLARGQASEALVRFEQVLRRQPSHEQARFNRAVALTRSDVNAARNAYEDLLTLRPDHQGAHLNLGALLLDAGQPSLARPHFETAKNLRPTPAVLFNLARACTLLGDEKAARTHLRAARSSRLENPRLPGPGAAQIDLALASLLLSAKDAQVRDLPGALLISRAVAQAAGDTHPIPLRAYAKALLANEKPEAAEKANAKAKALCADPAARFGDVCP